MPGKPTEYKWLAPLSPNEVFGGTAPAGTVTSWPFGTQRTYYSRIHKNSPAEACTSWATYGNFGAVTDAQRAVTGSYKIDDVTYKCAYDCAGGVDDDGEDDGDGDGAIMPNDYTKCGIVIDALTNLDTEEVCDRVPAGPYKGLDSRLTIRSIRGQSFSDTKRDAVLSANGGGGPLTSDVYGPPMNLDLFDELLSNRYTYLPYEDDPDFSLVDVREQIPVSDRAYAQIDHIVPRIDKYGCGCGPATYANALVVSAYLNGKMSNNSQDPNRVAIVNKWTKAPPSAARFGGAGAEDPDATDSAGCSVGGGGNGAMALVGLGLVVSLRRRGKPAP